MKPEKRLKFEEAAEVVALGRRPGVSGHKKMPEPRHDLFGTGLQKVQWWLISGVNGGVQVVDIICQSPGVFGVVTIAKG